MILIIHFFSPENIMIDLHYLIKSNPTRDRSIHRSSVYLNREFKNAKIGRNLKKQPLLAHEN